VQSIDKLETARALNKQAEAHDRRIDILLELNTSGEESKSGYRSPDELRAELESLAALPALRLRGLMTIAPFTREESPIRASFVALRTLFERLRSELGSESFDTVSMGMSNDYAIAIEEGATLVRIGTAIFGERE
ncbi:YggS family pyridoxal phosphate-dependent enzyme, partial [Salinispira pacifica]